MKQSMKMIPLASFDELGRCLISMPADSLFLDIILVNGTPNVVVATFGEEKQANMIVGKVDASFHAIHFKSWEYVCTINEYIYIIDCGDPDAEPEREYIGS